MSFPPKFAAGVAGLWLASCACGLAPALAADPVAAPVDAIVFTAEERAWIAAHPVIRAGHDPSFSPYAMLNTAGQIVGIDPDYLDLIARRTGLKFENQHRDDWGRMIADFKAGQVDLLPSLSHSPEREAYLIYTEAYAFSANVIITRSDAPNLSALSDLQGHTIGIPRGNPGLRRALDQSLPGNIVVEYETKAECYQAVEQGEVYASVGSVAEASHFIRTYQLKKLRFGSVISASSKFYFGVRKDWPMLVQIINKALAGISDEDRRRINSRWIVVDASPDQWQRWARAFKVAAGVAAVAVVVFLFVLFHNRRLAHELAERRRIQAELERTRDRLVQSNHERSELLHMVAHDLRGPLSAIQLGVELLQLQPPLKEANRETTTRRINESADQMARLINDLLSSQNVEEGRIALNFVANDAAQLVRAAVAAMYTVAQHKHITIEPLVPNETVRLTTDFVALQQVVDNLLSNALKYSPPGTQVEIALVAGPSHCRFEVRDQGPGVRPEEREKIFEKFCRGSAQPTQGEQSIGLGLWIVRRFVVALHGKVWCEPGPRDVGSVFVVEIPRNPPTA